MEIQQGVTEEGVTSINNLTGDVTLVGGTGITITPAGQNITITATGDQSVTLLDVSTNSTTTPNSVYQMTESIDVNFKTSGGTDLVLLRNDNETVVFGGNVGIGGTPDSQLSVFGGATTVIDILGQGPVATTRSLFQMLSEDAGVQNGYDFGVNTDLSSRNFIIREIVNNVAGTVFTIEHTTHNMSVYGSLIMNGSASGTVTLSVPATAGTRAIAFPANSGTVALTSDIPVVTNFATKALDNLASVAINASLVLATSDAFALGSTTKQWSDLFLAEGGVINWDNGDATLTQAGDVVTLAGAVFAGTSPRFTTDISDSAGNEIFKITATGSAVNEVTVANGATGNNWTMTASGETNTGITITGKGTKGVAIGNAFTEKVVTISDGAGAVIDCSLGNLFTWTATSDRTAGTTTNPVVGQKMIILFTASGGARTLTLPTAATGDFAFGSDITTISQTASGKTDAIGCIYGIIANRWCVVSFTKGF